MLHIQQFSGMYVCIYVCSPVYWYSDTFTFCLSTFHAFHSTTFPSISLIHTLSLQFSYSIACGFHDVEFNLFRWPAGQLHILYAIVVKRKQKRYSCLASYRAGQVGSSTFDPINMTVRFIAWARVMVKKRKPK